MICVGNFYRTRIACQEQTVVLGLLAASFLKFRDISYKYQILLILPVQIKIPPLQTASDTVIVSVSHALSCTPQVVGVGKERRTRIGRRKREFSLCRQHPRLKLSLGLSALCRQTLGGMPHRYAIA